MTITDEQPDEPHGLERIGNPRDDRPERHEHRAGQDGLDGPRQIEAGDQFELRDWRHQVAFVQATRLVVDEDDAAADHDHHEDRHHDRARQQVLDVGNVRIHLDHVERGLGGDARAGHRLVEGADERADVRGQRRRHEAVAVVLNQRDAGRILRQDPSRVVGRYGQDAVDASIAQVVERLSLVGVRRGVERPGVGGDGLRQLVDTHGRHPVIVIDDAQLEVLDVAAEGIAKDDELDQREDQRDDNERRTASKPAHFPLDDGQGASHQPRLNMKGESITDASCSESRSARPV